MLWRAEKPLRGWLGLGTLFDPLKIPAAHFYPQLDFSELSCLLYLVCHCLKVLLLKIWLWPDLLCTVRCFGFCHGFVYFHVILKLLKIMYPHGVSSRQKPVLWLACIIRLSWKKLLLRLLKYLRAESYRKKTLPLCPQRFISVYVMKSSLVTVLFSQHYTAGHLCFWMYKGERFGMTLKHAWSAQRLMSKHPVSCQWAIETHCVEYELLEEEKKGTSKQGVAQNATLFIALFSTNL